MSLILAIEPDRRQVAHLISIVRHVKGAELVLADTTERALESIGNNVPDLILVPALLSPQDDAALAAALRVIASAAHVQMLTIPTFAAPKPRAKKGMLSAFRRKPADEPPLEGCDPKVFAEEIASYLERASEERAAAQVYDDEQATARIAAQPVVTQAQDETLAGFEAAEADELAADTAAWTPTSSPATEEHYAASTAGVAAADPFAASPIQEEPAAEVFETPHAETSSAETSYVHANDVDVDAADQPWAAAASEPLEPVVEADAPVSTSPEPAWQHTAPDEEPEMAIEPPIAAAPVPDVPEMALDEFVATLEHTPAAEDVLPRAAAAPTDDPVRVPAFEDLLADFERANLPVIEEVHAEQWMAEPAESGHGDATAADDAENLDIDLSIDLDAVLRAAEPAGGAERARSLKPFEPVVSVERADPLPLSAWQAWPRLDWTAPEAAAEKHTGTGTGNGNGNGHGHGNGHHSEPERSDTSLIAEFQQEDEFEEALEEALEAGTPHDRFEPTVPVERVEPMPLAAWNRWPKLEGVAAEAYQEPIAPRKAAAKPEWVELMRSLREDISRRRAELAASGPIAPATQKSSQHPRTAAADTTEKSAKPPAPPAADDDQKPRPKRTRPIEDEWGLFDPEQCGFAALLDKLDEITAALPNAQSRRQSR